MQIWNNECANQVLKGSFKLTRVGVRCQKASHGETPGRVVTPWSLSICSSTCPQSWRALTCPETWRSSPGLSTTVSGSKYPPRGPSAPICQASGTPWIRQPFGGSVSGLFSWTRSRKAHSLERRCSGRPPIPKEAARPRNASAWSHRNDCLPVRDEEVLDQGKSRRFPPPSPTIREMSHRYRWVPMDRTLEADILIKIVGASPVRPTRFWRADEASCDERPCKTWNLLRRLCDVLVRY